MGLMANLHCSGHKRHQRLVPHAKAASGDYSCGPHRFQAEACAQQNIAVVFPEFNMADDHRLLGVSVAKAHLYIPLHYPSLR
jgi:hypothetical protein